MKTKALSIKFNRKWIALSLVSILKEASCDSFYNLCNFFIHRIRMRLDQRTSPKKKQKKHCYRLIK